MTEFGNRPPEFAVYRIGDMAQINFYTDAEKLPDTENGERWQANELHLTVPRGGKGWSRPLATTMRRGWQWRRKRRGLSPPRALRSGWLRLRKP